MKKILYSILLILALGFFSHAFAKSHITVNYYGYSPHHHIYRSHYYSPNRHIHTNNYQQIRYVRPVYYHNHPSVYGSLDYSTQYLPPRMRGGIGNYNHFYNPGNHMSFYFSI